MNDKHILKLIICCLTRNDQKTRKQIQIKFRHYKIMELELELDLLWAELQPTDKKKAIDKAKADGIKNKIVKMINSATYYTLLQF